MGGGGGASGAGAGGNGGPSECIAYSSGTAPTQSIDACAAGTGGTGGAADSARFSVPGRGSAGPTGTVLAL